jgi:hypothetical protein
MADPASLVFGVVGIVSLYSVCLQGYTQILSAKSLGKDAATLLCRLEIEEARFIVWGRNAGLLDNEYGNGCRLRLEDAEMARRALVQNRLSLPMSTISKRDMDLKWILLLVLRC